MKIIIAGATGLIGTEILRQSIHHPKITEIVTLTRREVAKPVGCEKGFRSVVVKDFLNYTEEEKEGLRGADGVIWLIAITPATLNSHTWEETVKICQDYTDYGIKTISALSGKDGRNAAMKFIYTTGVKSVRDPKDKPWILGDFSVLRGEVENRVLKFGAESGGKLDALVCKIGLVETEGMGFMEKVGKGVLKAVVGLPGIGLGVCARALLGVGVEGWKGEGETLENEDLIALGSEEGGG